MARTTCAVLATMLVIGCGQRDDATPDDQSIDPNDYIRTKGPAPQFLFPKQVECDRPEVNDFIRRFSRTSLKGEYLAYRLLVSRQVEPVSRESFQKAWEAVEQVRILSIARVDDLTNYPPPVYLVKATVAMREPADPPSREVAILVFQEGQEWVMAPAGRQIRQSQATSQPAQRATR